MKRKPCLFERWLAIEQGAGKSLAKIYDDINAACGMRYQSNWVSMMRSGGCGRKQMPVEVRRYMLRIVLPVEIPACAAMPSATLDQLIEHLI